LALNEGDFTVEGMDYSPGDQLTLTAQWIVPEPPRSINCGLW
jgi:hypothetical protein